MEHLAQIEAVKLALACLGSGISIGVIIGLVLGVIVTRK